MLQEGGEEVRSCDLIWPNLCYFRRDLVKGHGIIIVPHLATPLERMPSSRVFKLSEQAGLAVAHNALHSPSNI